MVLLVTSLPFALERGAGLPGFLVALVLIAVGVAGLKATLPPFLGTFLPLLLFLGGDDG